MNRVFLKSTKHDLHRAFSLLEITISTLLVSMVLVSSMQMVGNSLLAWHSVDSDVDAQAFAYDLMTEILATSYEDPEASSPDFGIESDETSSPANRSEFDDTDDYRNWTEAPPLRHDGSPIAGSTGWERDVDIQKLEANDATNNVGNGATDQGIRRVTVTVTDPEGTDFVLKAIVSKIGAVESATGVDSDFITGVTVELSAGTLATIVQGTDLINHAEGP